ncbi:MAG: MFS transporter [bacterium]
MSGSEDKGLRRTALLTAALASYVTPFLGSATNIALPAIEKEFQIHAVVVSWIPTAFLLAAAICLVPFGRVSDIFGRRRVFAAGAGVFTLGSVTAGLSFSEYMLIAARAMQGAGTAMIYANAISILTTVFPAEERGKVLGINVAAVYTGLATGPFLGGVLTQFLSWRSVFLFTVPLSLTVLFMVLGKFKQEWAHAGGEKFDFAGTAIYAASITSVMVGISYLPDLFSAALIGAGLLGMVMFVLFESRVKDPVFEVSLFKTNRLFAFSNLAALLQYTSTFGVPFLLSLFLQHVKGFGAMTAGAILVAQPVVMASLSPFAGKLSDRVEPRLVCTIGMACITLGIFLLTFIGPDVSIVHIIGALLVVGLGYAFFSSPNNNAIMSSVQKRQYGIASGTMGTMRVLGQMTSMGVATMLFAIIIGRVRISPESHPEFITSVQVAFTIFCALSFLAMIASIFRGRVRG